MSLLPEPSGAIISADGQYRYRLWREWDNLLPKCTFLMLNPSTADASQDDPTIRRCIGFARALKCGRLEVANLFPLRATDPEELMRHPNPLGQAQGGITADGAIMDAIDDASWVICAWGSHPAAALRAPDVLRMIRLCGRAGLLHHLGLNKDGSPKHPLYIAASVRPQRFEI